MSSFLYHLQINVHDSKVSFPFYKDLLTQFDYKVTHEDNFVLGMSNNTTDFWFIQSPEGFKDNKYHRKNIGLNHMAFGVASNIAVDKFNESFLKPRRIRPLYESPKEFPEYTPGYYAVFFEDPDRIKIEVTYIPGFEKKVKQSVSA